MTYMKSKANRMWKINKNTMFLLIFVGVIIPEVTLAWSPDAAEGNIRNFFGIVLGIIVAVRVISQYNKGQKGSAVGEGILGAGLSLFVYDSSVFKSIMEWLSTMLGF